MRIAETKTLLAIQDSDRGLINAFNGKIATPEQLHDLLNFRAIGKKLFTQRMHYYILRSPSVCAPTRKQSNGFKHSPRESQRNNEYLNWKEIKSWFKPASGRNFGGQSKQAKQWKGLESSS